MQIKEQVKDNEGLFYINDQGRQAGEIRFMLQPNNELEIYHTEVAPELQGQHWGEQLVEAVVNYARQHQQKVTPSCTFAKSVFARNAALRDVLG